MTMRGIGRHARTWKNAYSSSITSVIFPRVPRERAVTKANDLVSGQQLRQLHVIPQRRENYGGHSLYRRNLCTASDAQVYGEEWPEHEFSHIAEASLECISDTVADVGFTSENAPEDFDIELSQGVLTISLGSSGTYVLNTQTPNRQIWMSSPSSGPWRYAWNPRQKSWVSTRDGHMLNDRLTEELSDVFKESVLISLKDVSVA